VDVKSLEDTWNTVQSVSSPISEGKGPSKSLSATLLRKRGERCISFEIFGCVQYSIIMHKIHTGRIMIQKGGGIRFKRFVW